MLQHNIKANIDRNLPFSSFREDFVELIAVNAKRNESKYYSIVHNHSLTYVCVVG